MRFFPMLRTGASMALFAAPLVSCGDPMEATSEVSQSLTVYQVGPGKQYANLQAVASLLRPGDIVEVQGGTTYAGGVRLTQSGTAASKITIRGVRVGGARPRLSGGTNTIEFAANHIVFEGFDVTGGTSRCVFHHGHEITIRDTVIHDCPAHGILGADSGSGSLTLEYSEVYRSGSGDRLHQIYMATDETAYPGAVFRMQYYYVHDGNGGNNVKSRAERNEIYYNWIEGAYYHDIELIGPDGQDENLKREDSDVVGNVVYQGYTTRSHPAIRVGGDGTGQTFGRFRFLNNTIVLGNATHLAGISHLRRHRQRRDAQQRALSPGWRRGHRLHGRRRRVGERPLDHRQEQLGDERLGGDSEHLDGHAHGVESRASPTLPAATSSFRRRARSATPARRARVRFRPRVSVAARCRGVRAADPRSSRGRHGRAARCSGSGRHRCVRARQHWLRWTGGTGGTGSGGQPAPVTAGPAVNRSAEPVEPPGRRSLRCSPVEDTFVRSGTFASTNFGTATLFT